VYGVRVEFCLHAPPPGAHARPLIPVPMYELVTAMWPLSRRPHSQPAACRGADVFNVTYLVSIVKYKVGQDTQRDLLSMPGIAVWANSTEQGVETAAI